MAYGPDPALIASIVAAVGQPREPIDAAMAGIAGMPGMGPPPFSDVTPGATPIDNAMVGISNMFRPGTPGMTSSNAPGIPPGLQQGGVPSQVNQQYVELINRLQARTLRRAGEMRAQQGDLDRYLPAELKGMYQRDPTGLEDYSAALAGAAAVMPQIESMRTNALMAQKIAQLEQDLAIASLRGSASSASENDPISAAIAAYIQKEMGGSLPGSGGG